jgi:hypothetical protein
VLPLDTRQARIARRLLDGTGPTSADALASELALTPRVVRYNLPSVEAFLRSGGLRLVRRRGVGVWLDGEATSRHSLMARLDATVGPPVVDAMDRRARGALALVGLGVRTLSMTAPRLAAVRRAIRAASARELEDRATVARSLGTAVEARALFGEGG